MSSERKEAVRAHDEEAHAGIVHRLRAQGWDRWDAIDEADRIMARNIETLRPLPHDKEVEGR